MPANPRLIALRTISARGGEVFGWHAHDFDEFTLVTDDHCMIGHPSGWRPAAPNTLFHYRAGERHGAAAVKNQRPRFWVIHFDGSDRLAPASLSTPGSGDRVWSLTADRRTAFQQLFLQLLNERSAARTFFETAASAWLQLLLVNVRRWAEPAAAVPSPVTPCTNGEVLRLWQLVNEAVSRPNDELANLYGAYNYDSVRHAFRKAFGCSPREMLLRMRMENAKNLLLESSLSIKEIADRVGYVQPHDFNRLFHRYTGVAPSQWRSNPCARATAERDRLNKGANADRAALLAS